MVTAKWSSIPFYVVGQATAAALSSVRAVCNHTPYSPGPTLGESSGTGEQLANFILSFEGRPIPKMLLYLTGDKNRDTVPRILGEADIVVNPVKVYETKFSSNFTRDLEAAFQNVSKSLSPFSRPKFTTSTKQSHSCCRIQTMVDRPLCAVLCSVCNPDLTPPLRFQL